MTSIFDPDLAAIRRVTPRTPDGCEECLRLHTPWLHLRLCLSCGTSGVVIRLQCTTPVNTPTRWAIQLSNLSSPVNRGVGVMSTKSMSEVADV